MPRTLFDELTSAFKIPLQDGESYEQFATRATNRINKCSQEQWDGLSKGLQVWNNKVLEVRDENTAPDEDAKASGSHLVGLLPELPGFPVLEEGTENEDTGEETPIEDDEAQADGEEGDNKEAEAETTAQDETEAGEAPSEEEPTPRKKLGASKPGKIVKANGKAPKEAKAPKAAKPAKVAKKAGGGKAKLPDTHKIKILAKENPHRPGTGRFKRWPKYKDGMTVAAALKAGFNPNNIRYSVADGHIKLVP